MTYTRPFPLDSLLNLMEQFCHQLPNEIEHCSGDFPTDYEMNDLFKICQLCKINVWQHCAY